MILFIFASDSTISPKLPIAPPASPLPAPLVTTGVSVWLAIFMTATTSSVLFASTTQIGSKSLVLPERSVRAAARLFGSVSTASPRASMSWRRTTPGSSGLLVTENPSQSYAKNNRSLPRNQPRHFALSAAALGFSHQPSITDAAGQRGMR